MEEQVRKKSAHIIATNKDQNIPYEQNVAEQIAAGGRFTDEELAPRRLRAYSTGTIKLLLESVDNVSFLTRGAQPNLTRQVRIFDELASRGGATPDAVSELFQRFLAARLFDEATALKSRFPDVKLWDLPEIIETAGPSEPAFRVYDVSSDSKTATVRRLPMETGPKIVVSAWNSCPVTAKAFRLIEADPKMLQPMQAYGMILTGRFEPGGVAAQNAKRVAARMYIARTERDWPAIGFGLSHVYFSRTEK